MSNLKQALYIIQFEFKHSARYLLLQLVLIGFLLYLYVPVTPQFFSNSGPGLDVFFLAIITTFSQLFIPKPFKSQSLQDGRWASHFIITLNQLAIPKKTIVMYRFISYYVVSLIFTSIFLIALYLFSPLLQQQVPLSTYVVFIIFWLSIGVTIGGAQPVIDTGYNIIFSFILVFLFIGPLFLLIMLILFYFIYPNGFVQWSLMVSTKWPLQTVVISIIIAIISCRIWVNLMKKRMTKQDYFS